MSEEDKELYMKIYNLFSINNDDLVERISGFYNGPDENQIYLTLKNGKKKVITIYTLNKEGE